MRNLGTMFKNFQLSAAIQFGAILFGVLTFMVAPNSAFAFRVYPTTAQNEVMLDKNNFPFIAENADGFNLQHDSFGPFSAGQVETIFNQFKNKNFINHGVYKHGVPITSMSTMNKMPSFANVTAMMLYNEAPAMDEEEWASALAQNAPWPLITHCRAFGHSNNFNELKRQIRVTSGCMFEFQVTKPDKYDDALELTKYCVDNDRMVVFLTTFQKTPDIFIAAYKEFFYYLKENLDPKYLNSDHVIFIPNTYDDSEVLPETKGYGSTFGVAHWLIDQKNKVNDGYIQPKVDFAGLENDDYFPNHSDLTVNANITSDLLIEQVELYIDGVLVGEDNTAPYSWSGGELADLTAGYKNLKLVATDDNGIETTQAIQIRILNDPPVVPGFFMAGEISDYKLRNDPWQSGEIRHVYANEWIDYKLDVRHTGNYDVEIGMFVQRSKQFGGTIILKKGSAELGRFTTVLNDPDKPVLNDFTETPDALIKNVYLTKGMQTIRVTFSHPNNIVRPQFRLFHFNFKKQGAPDIEFTTPAKNEAGIYNSYDAPASIKIAANITSPRLGGEVKTASLYMNDSLVSIKNEEPFVWNNQKQDSLLNNVPAGDYILKIVATDELNYTSFKELELKVIDRQPFNPNHTIPGVIKAIEFDIGGEGIAYHDFNEGLERGLGGIENPRYAKAGNEDVEIDRSAGDYSVSAIRRNEWLNYTISDVQKGTYDIVLTTAANSGKSADVRVWLDGEIIATIHTSQTAQSGFGVYKEFSVSGIEIPNYMTNATVKLEFINPNISTYLCFFRKFEFRKQEEDGTPTVSFITPAEDTTLLVDYTDFNIKATASVEGEYTVSDVSLYVDDNLVLKDAVAPYQWNAGDLPKLKTGMHSIRAVATSSSGASSSALIKVMVRNPALEPVITQVAPASGSTVDASKYLEIWASVIDPDMDLKEVSLKINNQLVQTLSLSPFIWSGVESLLDAGANTITIIARDKKGHSTDSTFVINAGNLTPAISMSMLKPAGIQEIVVEEGYTLDVDVQAESSVGSIERVTLFIDGVEIRTERGKPYTWGHAGSPNTNELNGLSVGTHELKFIAFDSKGNQNELIVSLIVEVATNIYETEVSDLVSLYPNPAKTYFTIRLNESIAADVYIYNLLGELVMKKNIVGHTTINRLNLMNAGSYIICIHTKKYGLVTKKLVLQ